MELLRVLKGNMDRCEGAKMPTQLPMHKVETEAETPQRVCEYGGVPVHK